MGPLAFLFLPLPIFLLLILGIGLIRWVRRKSGPGVKKMRETTTAVSILEIKVNLPSRVIFRDESAVIQYDPSELAQIPAASLGEGTLGPLYKAVLNSGSIVTIRKLRHGHAKREEIESWIRFFGGIRDTLLSPIRFGFWYGSEAFVVYDYMCLGSLEELLHGKEGIQFTPLDWGIRLYIAQCAAMAVANLHSITSEKGEALVCGVIKASNVLIRTDFSACLCSYETPYLACLKLILRRNPGRIAPEVLASQGAHEFTQKSDVYSFGVLLLELITGKKPMVSNENGEVKLVEYVKYYYYKREDGLECIYDKKMGDVTQDKMSDMVEIAQLCVQSDPTDRPTMESVVKMIYPLQTSVASSRCSL